MSTNDSRPYLPKERNYMEQHPEVIKAYSEEDYAVLPDPVTDPIVSNNISNAEFDYTDTETEYPGNGLNNSKQK